MVGYGLMVKRALNAATALEADGVAVEVVDLRTISPLDEEPILQSVRKIGSLKRRFARSRLQKSRRLLRANWSAPTCPTSSVLSKRCGVSSTLRVLTDGGCQKFTQPIDIFPF